MILEPIFEPETGRWSVYLGTWQIARGLDLLGALRVAGYHVAEA